MKRKSAIAALLAWGLLTVPAGAGRLIEPQLHIAKGGTTPQVALTLDACSGGVDERILDTIIDNAIPATVFVTGRWLAANPVAVTRLLAYPELFEIEDHGANHIPAVIGDDRPYGLMPAGTAEGVRREVEGGAEAVLSVTNTHPRWYRGAAALYSADALALIHALGFSVAGFSLNADLGASASAAVTAARIAAAQDGDVIIAHMNQPKRASGAGVAKGILTLKAKGFRFVRLADVEAVEE